jgi:hypothetical protein
MKLLDLFCGAGGAAMGYHRAGFEIVGVDIKPQPHYPFEFHQADAMTYSLDGYDVIHASPPCQGYSIIMNMKRSKSQPKLIDPLQELLLRNGKPFVIENVEGAPLKNPILLCGSYFGLGMIRHRIFEVNPSIFSLFPSCNHKDVYDPWHFGTKQREKMSCGMGIDWFMTRSEAREAIPPAYTEWIGKRLMEYLKR